MTSRIHEYTREACPICGHMGWCGRREDGLVLCKRPPSPPGVTGYVFKGLGSDEQTALYVEAGLERGKGAIRPRPPAAPAKAKTDSRELAQVHVNSVAAMTPELRRRLADALRLPVAALDALPIGWWANHRWWNAETARAEGEAGCWTFPECDAQGGIVGLGLRWPDGRKGQMAGGHRGLTLPSGWSDLTDPILLVEGPSDVLAGRWAGLGVAGRPSNSGGVELLSRACQNRRVVVLGENDRKPDGRWPGREGAQTVARRLEGIWRRPVPVAFPPEGIKDLRAWIVQLAPDHEAVDPGSVRQTILTAVQPPALLLMASPADRRGRVVVTASRWADDLDAGPVHSDRLSLEDATARQRFVKAAVKIEPAAGVDTLIRQLMSLAPPETARRSTPAPAASVSRAVNTPAASSDSNGPSKPEVFVPGGPAPIQESAQQLGALLAGTGKFFFRGGEVTTIGSDNEGHPVLETLRAAALASTFETVARLMSYKRSDGDWVAVEDPCTEQQARLIQHCAAFRDRLPPIRLLSRCAVLIEREGELVQISGYDRGSGILTFGGPAAEVPLDAAVGLLSELLTDFHFATPADRARALAALITPALVFGGLIGGRAPVDLGEADASQSGKGYRNKLTAAIYSHAVRTVTQKKGGVGSMEETFCTALIRGCNFVALDNVRGVIDSPAIESFLTEDVFLARVPYQAAVEIDPRRVILQLTSNRAEITLDLANRSSCVRILKQAEGHHFRRYPEGDVLDHLRARQPEYLGAVFAVVRAWHQARKPKTNETRHDFRPWARTLDWIVQNIFKTGPLLDGHRETQMRMATPALNWLRDVALAVRNTGQMNTWLRANRLVDIISESPGVELPGLTDGADLNDDEVRRKLLQSLGRRLHHCFEAEGTRRIDGFEIERQEQFDAERRRTVREYRFRTAAADPDYCSYAPEGIRRTIGAAIGAEPPVAGESPPDRDGPGGRTEVCAYRAPIAAPKAAPIGSLYAPNAPIDDVTPPPTGQNTNILDSTGVILPDHTGDIGTDRRIGAIGAIISNNIPAAPPVKLLIPSPGLILLRHDRRPPTVPGGFRRAMRSVCPRQSSSWSSHTTGGHPNRGAATSRRRPSDARRSTRNTRTRCAWPSTC